MGKSGYSIIKWNSPEGVLECLTDDSFWGIPLKCGLTGPFKIFYPEGIQDFDGGRGGRSATGGASGGSY